MKQWIQRAANTGKNTEKEGYNGEVKMQQRMQEAANRMILGADRAPEADTGSPKQRDDTGSR
jgi:hypothetical protein